MHSDTKNWNYCNKNIERIMQLQEISSLWNGEKMKYKALALDLDGTLINSEKKLSTKNKKAVKERRSAACILFWHLEDRCLA